MPIKKSKIQKNTAYKKRYKNRYIKHRMCEVRNGNKKETKQKSSPEMCKREALEFLLNSRNMNGSRLAIRALKKKQTLL